MYWFLQLGIVILFYDIHFYYFHRLLHTKRLYAYHKKHHEYTTDVSAKSTYHAGHFENALSGVGVLYPYLLFEGVGIPAVFLGSIMCFIMGIIHHDPDLIQLPVLRWFFDDHHIQHHHNFHGNYGRYWIDYIHGTVRPR